MVPCQIVILCFQSVTLYVARYYHQLCSSDHDYFSLSLRLWNTRVQREDSLEVETAVVQVSSNRINGLESSSVIISILFTSPCLTSYRG